MEAVKNGKTVSDQGSREDESRFEPSEEEVEAALSAWRLKRAGATADTAAAHAATAAAEVRAEAHEVGPVWDTLSREFTEQQSTEALFSNGASEKSSASASGDEA